MSDEYIVIRGANPAGRANVLGTNTRSEFRATAFGASPPEVTVEVLSLEAQDVADLREDPSVLGPCRRMPVRLIGPVAIASSTDGTDASGGAWGIAAVGANASQFTGAGVVVAVLDTGVDAAHEAFKGVDFEHKDFTGSDSALDDVNGHGTHCAGTIFGRDIGGVRVGVAPGVDRVLVGKVLNDDGSGTSDSIFQGLQWATNAGAHVISMSVGFDFATTVKRQIDEGWPPDLATSKALEFYGENLRTFDGLMGVVRSRQSSFGAGSVVLAASGNESHRDVRPDYVIAASLPASADGITSVAAFGRGKTGFETAPFSNGSAKVSAPGVDIVSAKVGGGTAVMSGTSMACPHAAGVTALWWEALRTSGAVASAEAVTANLIALARRDGFAPGSLPTDRGNGAVCAPGPP